MYRLQRSYDEMAQALNKQRQEQERDLRRNWLSLQAERDQFFRLRESEHRRSLSARSPSASRSPMTESPPYIFRCPFSTRAEAGYIFPASSPATAHGKVWDRYHQEQIELVDPAQAEAIGEYIPEVDPPPHPLKDCGVAHVMVKDDSSSSFLHRVDDSGGTSHGSFQEHPTRASVPTCTSPQVTPKSSPLFPAAPSAQIENTFWVTVWQGFHRDGRSARVIVHHYYRHISHVIEKAARDLCCMPAPSILYTPDGKTIADLKQLKPGNHYLIFPSGCLYRESAVPTLLLEILASGQRKRIAELCEGCPARNATRIVPISSVMELY